MPLAILAADDDPDDIFSLSRAFLTAGLPHRVIPVSDGQEAINYLMGEGGYVDRYKYPLPGLLILDLSMPRKDGFEVLQWLRERRDFDYLPVAVISGSEKAEDIQRAKALGADDYRIKPAGLPGWVTIVKDLAARWLTSETRRARKPRDPAATSSQDA